MRSKSKFLAAFLSLSVLLFITGCSAKKLYYGPKLHESQLALIQAYQNGLFIREVDSNEAMVGSEGSLKDLIRIQHPDAFLLPGEHIFTVKYFTPVEPREAILKADLKAGGKYMFQVLRTLVPAGTVCNTSFPEVRTTDGKIVDYFPIIIDTETKDIVSTIIRCYQLNK